MYNRNNFNNAANKNRTEMAAIFGIFMQEFNDPPNQKINKLLIEISDFLFSDLEDVGEEKK